MWIFWCQVMMISSRRAKSGQIWTKTMIFMVLSNGIGCELHANALSIIVLCFVKHLQALGNCFRALLSLKYQLEIDFDQFWLTADKVSESTL